MNKQNLRLSLPNSRVWGSHFKRTIWSGLITVLPLALTFYLAFLVWVAAETFFGGFMTGLGMESSYVPGMGFLLGVLLLYALGLSARRWFGQIFIEWSEDFVSRIPLLKTVYGVTRDVIQLLSSSKHNGDGQPVLVTIPNLNIEMVGIVTNTSVMTSLGIKDGYQDDLVLVYLPMSYQLGGYSVVVSRSNLKPLELSLEESMRFLLTAGASRENPAKIIKA